MEVCKRCGFSLAETYLFCPQCGRAVSYSYTHAPKKRGNGQGTAIKRGKTWTGFKPGYSYHDDNGKKHRVRPSKGGFATKREALAWASGSGADDGAAAPRLIDLWEGWSKNDMLQLSSTKQCAYKIARKRLEPIIDREIDSLTVDDLQDVINTKCNSYYTARDCKNLLSHLYKRAMAANGNRGKVTQNLSEFLVMPAAQEKEAVPLTMDEVSKLWTAYDNGDLIAGYILLLIYTGMMPGELLACKKSMVDLDSLEIRGAGLKTKTRQKSAIAFPEFIAPVLSELIAQSGSKEKLLSMNKDNFYAAFYDSIKAAGIDNPEIIGPDGKKDHRITPYSCRHTYGTEAVRMGLHPAIVQKMLRHSNTKTQEKYTHLGGEDLHEAVNQLKKSGHNKPSSPATAPQSANEESTM
jgi:integrase